MAIAVCLRAVRSLVVFARWCFALAVFGWLLSLFNDVDCCVSSAVEDCFVMADVYVACSLSVVVR